MTDDRGDSMTGVELGAKNYDVNSYLDGEPSVTLAVFQLPGSNALQTATAIQAKMEELKQKFPEGVEYHIVYDTTVFIEESITSVIHTLIEAFVLVFIVVLVFLQNWRATHHPHDRRAGVADRHVRRHGAAGVLAEQPVAVRPGAGHRHRGGRRHRGGGKRGALDGEGLVAAEASRKAMDEVTGPVIAIALVLCAVFVPTAFMAGISGQFYKQFALTIAASTVISAFNSLTLSPALCALLLKPTRTDTAGAPQEALPRVGIALIGGLIAYVFLLGAGRPTCSTSRSAGTAATGARRPTEHTCLVWALQAGLFAAGLRRRLAGRRAR